MSNPAKELEHEQMKHALDEIARTADAAQLLAILAISESPDHDENNKLIVSLQKMIEHIGWISDRYSGWRESLEAWVMPPTYPHSIEDMERQEAIRREACREDVEPPESSAA